MEQNTKNEIESDFNPPRNTFNRRFDASTKPTQFKAFSPNRKEIAKLLAMAHRIASYVGEELAEDRKPLFDLQVPSMTPPKRLADQGLPLGGIGCGSIGRSHTGNFNRIDFQPGRSKNGTIRGIQFIVRGKRNGEPASAAVLSTLDKPKSNDSCGDMHHWNWESLNPAQCFYHSLFPRAWYTYNQPLQNYPNLRLTCRQINPIAPHNYNDSALPTTVFRWRLENTGTDEIDVSLMFAFDANATINESKNKEYIPKYGSNSSSNVAGVTMTGNDIIPKTELRSEWMDSPNRTRYCTFREFILFFFLFFISLLIVGPYLYFYSEEQWWYAWMIVTLSFLLCSQIAFYLPCQIHTRWINQNVPNGWCHSFKSKLKYDYHVTNVSYTISADVNNKDVKTTISTHYPTTGQLNEQTNGTSSLWEKFVTTGEASTIGKNSKNDGSGGCAVAQSIVVKPGESRELRFCLSWASPVVHFGEDMVVLRRYARLIQPTDNINIQNNSKVTSLIAEKVNEIALNKWKIWESKINRWQESTLNDQSLPSWYKSQLYNELYFLQAGGAIWCDKINEEKNNFTITDDDFKDHDDDNTTTLETVGHWLYLEGQEYFMYNTADVHFYASAALAMNWPLIERSIQCDYADTVLQEDKQMRGQLGEPRWGSAAMRKPFGVVPHDVGSPSGLPWLKNNSYHFQDVSRWKDLGSKFVLQVMRDYQASCNEMQNVRSDIEEKAALKFVKKCWPAVLAVMNKMKDFDRDNDGMIENEGFPDQTYDIWSAKGPSAYSGGLWLASLQAASFLANLMNDTEKKDEYNHLFMKGQKVYEDLLWNDEHQCYDYDASESEHHDSIMADQMVGEWFSRTCHFNGVVSTLRSKRALKTVYDRNVMGFHKGAMGAMNGMRPNGMIDRSSMQSQEVWTGTTYAVAAAMIHVGLKDEGFQTASGIHHAGWHQFGYFFQTPEAWNEKGNYRSLGYMRALSIWNMQWALSIEKKRLKQYMT